MKTVNGTAH